jgi:hypothetical protein
MCIATRHESWKDNHLAEISELQQEEKHGSRRRKCSITYEDEIDLLKGVIGNVRGKPPCLKKLSAPAIGVLAYALKSKMTNEPVVEGYEIIQQLVLDPEKTILYLNSIGELKDKGWIRLIEIPGRAFTDQPPFTWLQAPIELGDTFHRELGVAQHIGRTFESNDSYLDAVMTYLQAIINDDSELYRVSEPDTDLTTMQPHDWYRRIGLAVESSTSKLPAAEAKGKYNLSVYQHLALIGLLGMRDRDLTYDFSDPADVVRIFAQGRVCRQRMREHIFGEQSTLMRHKLLEGTRSEFGESVRLSQLGIKALLGRQSGGKTAQELKSWVKKNTLFDFEEPGIKHDAVMLPPKVLESIRTIIFSESSEGKKVRKEWLVSFPTAWGAPTGSTILLFGPPGTGKTLTAQYIASELKLPLLKIDAARVLSCWVGESEQQVRRVFDDYTRIQQEIGISPVLLLNEADQLLGSRDAGTNSVDRMNNNMQNLFLEGLERFSGIMVATTNRRDLLDESFSRRFSFKLELPSPDQSLRMELWKSHLPLQRLAEDVDIGQLADINLSGGEIRLVVERAVRLLAYQGHATIDHKTLNEIAREEITSRMKRTGTSGRIGFGTV